jgi:uracil-DNA glycosylase family 4
VSGSTLADVALEASTCMRCRLAEGRTSVVFGVGDPRSDLLFVGEAPGREEDLTGEPFVGRSGRLLDTLVSEELGMTRSDFYIANVVKCRPPSNRDPLPDEVATCRPYLDAQVAAIAPRVTVTLGNFATQSLLGVNEGVTKLRGRSYPFGDGVLIPTFHPAYALRGGGAVTAQIRADLVRVKVALNGGQ